MVSKGQVRVSRSRPPAIPTSLTVATSLLMAASLAASLAACGLGPDRRLEKQRAAAEQQRHRLESQCRRDREWLSPLLDAVDRSQARLTVIEAETYVPSAAPVPLDPLEQRRLATYDQEIVQEQYEQTYSAWQEREGLRRASWRLRHGERLGQARREHANAIAALQAKAPALLTATDPPQINRAERLRRLGCGATSR